MLCLVKASTQARIKGVYVHSHARLSNFITGQEGEKWNIGSNFRNSEISIQVWIHYNIVYAFCLQAGITDYDDGDDADNDSWGDSDDGDLFDLPG